MADEWKDYKEEGSDIKGRKIDAIFCHHETHILYEANGKLEIDGNTSSLDSDGEANLLLSQIMALSPKEDPSRRIHFTQLSQALNSCMTGDGAGGRKNLRLILKRLQNKKNASARLVFLWSSIFACAMIWVVYLILFFVNNQADAPWAYTVWGLVIAFSASGGALSVAIRQDDLPVDPDKKAKMHISNGVSRIVLALLSGIVCYLAIKSGTVLSILENRDGNYAVYFFCFLSGFSEKFIPNVLSSAEENA